jgi:7,8-dihydropterin-6-yl-methyl-4-(beta-D-ribofuranosyl)aminobenzene 5'-phosphate synthase
MLIRSGNLRRMKSMGVRLITLSENTAWQTEVLAEWGLSVLIEKDGRGILLDTGETISAAQNAETLGIDLTEIDTIVLSHGHYDHTGGLPHLLARIGHEVNIIAHPDIWAPKYSLKDGRLDKYVGIPYSRHELEALGAKFRLSTGPVNLDGEILTTGEVPMLTDFETIDSALVLKTETGWQPDPLLDDQGILIKSAQGLVVIPGCAHRGLINTLLHARKITGTEKIHLVLGGAHLIKATDEQIWQTISSLNEMGVQKLATCHCTGLRANILLMQTFGKNFILNSTGTIINLS